MRIFSPAWIIVVGVWLAHASGVFQIVGPIFSGIDGAISTVVDVRKLVAVVKPHETMKAQRHARIVRKEKHK